MPCLDLLSVTLRFNFLSIGDRRNMQEFLFCIVLCEAVVVISTIAFKLPCYEPIDVNREPAISELL